MNDYTASDLIEGAIDTVSDGWCQGRLAQWDSKTDTTTYCTIGAVEHAKTKFQEAIIERVGWDTYILGLADGEGSDVVVAAGEAYRAIVAELQRRGVQEGPSSIAKWNDAPERTKEDVVEMLTAVAKDLRNQGN